ncbi:hypothetical protein KKG83_00365 [Candidatus Micrarchaeota archaeon]|nr:hypothetical protein [Candidatus Micrarchaeota archaeon]MBU2475904.1 hypothetical protein [Candidatus Micrarchaeota archaeon]
MQEKKKFYLDTCIWRDYFEDRKDNLKPLGEFAFQFLKKCIKENAVIFVSDLVIEELKKDYSLEQIELMFSDFKHLIVRTVYSREQAKEAFQFQRNTKKKFPLSDVLHSIMSRDEKAILVTRDKHFEEIKISETDLPENLL